MADGFHWSTTVVGATLMVKQLVRRRFYLVLAVVQPLLYLTIAGLLAQDQSYLPGAAVGAGVMGMWSATLFGAGGALDRGRWQGTLEHLLITPAPLVYPVLGMCFGAASLGLLSMATALVTAWVAFGLTLPLTELLLVAGATVVALFGMGALGILTTSVFLLARQARALSNLLEYPVWICSGLLLPADTLPSVLRWIGFLFTPTWAARLLDEAVRGNVGSMAAPVCWLVLLTVAYFAAGLVLLGRIEFVVRRRGDLSFI